MKEIEALEKVVVAKEKGLDVTKGAYVDSLLEKSAAAAAGIQPGDLIQEVNRQPIRDMNDYIQAIRAAKKGESLLLLIGRGEGSLFVVLNPVSAQ